MMTRQAAKRELKNKGWSQRKAAAEFGVTMEHLNRVLNGRRESRRLVRLIEALPANPQGRMMSGFAVKPFFRTGSSKSAEVAA